MGYVFGVLLCVGAGCFAAYSVLKLIQAIKARKNPKGDGASVDDDNAEE